MFAGRLMAIFCAFTGLLLAQPATTTIQDTIFNADGTPFNGSVIITWNSFQASDGSPIAAQNLTVPIVNGGLFVQLVPDTNATPVNFYTASYQSGGVEQFTETWAVPPSSQPLRLAAVRITGSTPISPADPTSGTTPTQAGSQTPIQETDVIGLAADLGLRPVKGSGFSPGRSAVINNAGELEAAAGDSGDCVHVDGSTGPCFDAAQMASFVDSETPAGTVDGNNNAFTLVNAPSPSVSLSLFRNGIYQTLGTDFTLTGNAIQFLTGATPQPYDVLTATYRIGGTAAGSSVRTINTSFPLSGGGPLQADLTISLTDAAFLRRGHKTMVIGDSQAGGTTPDLPFPTVQGNWFAQAVVESRSAIRYAGNAGVVGDTTANMLLRLITDVIPKTPDKVFIEAGYSDINAGVPVTTVAANIAAMVSQLKAANILPILCTLPPHQPADANGVNPSSTTSLVQLNFQIRQIADNQGIPLVDFYSLLVDPGTGLYRTGYSSDGINPGMPATYLMAQAAIAATKSLYDANSPWLAANDNDGINLLNDPVFVRVPSLWSQTAVTGLPARLTFVPGAAGNTMSLQKTDSSAVNVVNGSTISTGFSPGDRLAFSGTMSSTNCQSGNLSFDVGLQFNPGTVATYPLYHWSVDVQSGVWYVEFTVPAGATSMTPVFQLNQGTGTVVIGQVGVVNLTAMGF